MIDDQAVYTEEQTPSAPRRFVGHAQRIFRFVVAVALVFGLGLGTGYFAWGRTTALTDDHRPEAAPTQAGIQIDFAALSRQVNPPEGYTLTVAYGDLGPSLVAAGAIDLDRFVQMYEQAGRSLTQDQLAVLSDGSDHPIVIDAGSASFLLNFFWAVGLTNQNRILTEGPMMQGGKDQVGNFASTAGWTIGKKSATELYASTSLITLTTEQQLRLEEVAKNVYRPCCNNPTHFPDCNHGMAMLGLLELMASQDATTDEMLTAAKYVNAFWYPQQTLEQAMFFKAAKALDFDQVQPGEIVGARYSSASGFQAVHKLLADNGLLRSSPGEGNSCGVQP
ncbi:MAG TPA: hypothetical protein VJG32_16880 [Anaerolineae bacterium]|nr:hypothetical protein [Anaerolineae bacterium]